MSDENTPLIDDAQIEELNAALVQKYGYDFSEYSRASLSRRLNRIISKFKQPSYISFKTKVLNDEIFFNTVLEEITVTVTEMFRDPLFFKALREEIIPHLSSYPIIRIWHSGCSSGEEVYSMAILLKEAGLLERSLLYATDINMHVLDQAKSGIFSLDNMNDYSSNYILAGGQNELSSYYVAQYGKAHFNKELSEKMVFAPHNLVVDQSFNEFNLVVCRNVLIYFNQNLQNKVIRLFSDSLSSFGYLALGSKESIQFTSSADNFDFVNSNQKIWVKKK